MRLRNTALAAFSALTVLLAVPQSASAALGEFTYVYTDNDGNRHTATLLDPEGRECHNLPQVTDPNTSTPADSPQNRTTKTATVFSEPDCNGDYVVLTALEGKGDEQMKLRSVVFSD